MAIAKRVCERITAGMKRLVPIIEQQKTRDVSEADTVTLVKDLLAEVFGYDKYSDVTSEYAIRGTYCDLAIKLEDKLVELIEVKAIGISLDDRHVRQVVDYAANEGIEWVILTNGITWRLYHVLFEKPIDKQLVAEIDLTTLDCRRERDLEALYPFTKEGFQRGAPSDLRDRQDATNRFLLAAILLENDAVLAMIRRELRKIVDVVVDDDEISRVLRDEVIKREVLEGQPATSAANRVKRAESKAVRDKVAKEAASQEPVLVTASFPPETAPATAVEPKR
jgi:predicted type IV restriction endonuclease